MIPVGNFFYFLAILSFVFITILTNYLTNRLGKRFAYILCTTLLWMNFLLHFYKQFSPYYLQDFPYMLRASTLENLCAASIFFSPFVYRYGTKWLKSYMAIISIISGAVVLIMPTTAIGKDLSDISNLTEVLRFYSCHVVLILVPILMLTSGQIKIEYRYCWNLSLCFMCHMMVIFVNEALLMASGLVQADWLDLLSRDYRNSAAAMGLPSSMDAMLGWLYCIMPHFYIDGVLYFVPAIWAVVPLVLLCPFIGLAFAYPSQKWAIKADWRGLKTLIGVRLRERRLRRAA